MEAVIVLGVILAAAVGLVLILSRAGRARAPVLTATTAQPQQQSGVYGWREYWAIPMAVLAMLIVWYIVNPVSFDNIATNKTFLGGLALVMAGTYLLAVPQKFADRWNRKILLTTAVLGGLTLMVSKVLPPVSNWGTYIAQTISQQTAAAQTPQPRKTTVDISSNQWKSMRMTRAFSYYSPGWLEFRYPNGMTVRVESGEKKDWNPPSADFEIRGEPYVEFTY